MKGGKAVAMKTATLLVNLEVATILESISLRADDG